MSIQHSDLTLLAHRQVVPLAIEIAGVSRVWNMPRAGGTGLSVGEAKIIRGIGLLLP